MSHFVKIAKVFFYNSYKEYIGNKKPDEKFTVIDIEGIDFMDMMDVIIYETICRRMLSGKLNYFKIVENYEFVEDENDEQE